MTGVQTCALPICLSVVGGLVLSQLLTLYTTPVVFVLMDRLRAWGHAQAARFARTHSKHSPTPQALP